MPPDEPNDEERLEELPEDNGTPFRPADDTNEPVVDPDADEEWTTESEESSPPSSEMDVMDDVHPDTDTGIVQAELYDEGIPGSAGDGELEDDIPDGFHEEGE